MVSAHLSLFSFSGHSSIFWWRFLTLSDMWILSGVQYVCSVLWSLRRLWGTRGSSSDSQAWTLFVVVGLVPFIGDACLKTPFPEEKPALGLKQLLLKYLFISTSCHLYVLNTLLLYRRNLHDVWTALPWGKLVKNNNKEHQYHRVFIFIVFSQPIPLTQTIPSIIFQTFCKHSTEILLGDTALDSAFDYHYYYLIF